MHEYIQTYRHTYIHIHIHLHIYTYTDRVRERRREGERERWRMESEEDTIDTTLSNKSGAASTATSELHAPRAVIRRTCMRRTTRSTRTKTRDEGRRTKSFFFEGCAATPLEAIRSNVMQASSLLGLLPVAGLLPAGFARVPSHCHAPSGRREAKARGNPG